MIHADIFFASRSVFVVFCLRKKKRQIAKSTTIYRIGKKNDDDPGKQIGGKRRCSRARRAFDRMRVFTIWSEKKE